MLLLGENAMALNEILIVLAILAGPVFAVFITRTLDDRGARRQRRYEIYKALMATRRNALSAEHVNTLNLLAVEFHNAPKVLKAWREYFTNLCARAANEEQWQQILNDRDILFVRLMTEMTKTLKMKGIEQVDIMRGAYVPVWAGREQEQAFITQALTKILKGEAALPVALSSAGLHEEPGARGQRAYTEAE